MNRFTKGDRVRPSGANGDEGARKGVIVMVSHGSRGHLYAVRWDGGTTVPGYRDEELEAAG